MVTELEKIIEQANPEKIDYISVVSYHDLQHIARLIDKSIVAVAAFFGTTRLIDNIIIESKDEGYRCIY